MSAASSNRAGSSASTPATVPRAVSMQRLLHGTAAGSGAAQMKHASHAAPTRESTPATMPRGAVHAAAASPIVAAHLSFADSPSPAHQPTQQRACVQQQQQRSFPAPAPTHMTSLGVALPAQSPSLPHPLPDPASNPASFSSSDRVARELDAAAVHLLLELERLTTSPGCLLPRELVPRVEGWCMALSRVPSATLSLQRDRDAYLRLLLEQVQRGVLAFPFDKAPPSGPLPRLPLYLHGNRPLPPRRRAWHEAMRAISDSVLEGLVAREAAAAGVAAPSVPESRTIGGRKEEQKQAWLRAYHTDHRSPERVARPEHVDFIPKPLALQSNRINSLRAQWQNSAATFAASRELQAAQHAGWTPDRGFDASAPVASPYSPPVRSDAANQEEELVPSHSFSQHVHPTTRRNPNNAAVHGDSASAPPHAQQAFQQQPQGLVPDVVLAKLAREQAQAQAAAASGSATPLSSADGSHGLLAVGSYTPFAAENAHLKSSRDALRAERDQYRAAWAQAEFETRALRLERDMLRQEVEMLRAKHSDADGDQALSGEHATTEASAGSSSLLRAQVDTLEAERRALRAQVAYLHDLLSDQNRRLADEALFATSGARGGPLAPSTPAHPAHRYAGVSSSPMSAASSPVALLAARVQQLSTMGNNAARTGHTTAVQQPETRSGTGEHAAGASPAWSIDVTTPSSALHAGAVGNNASAPHNASAAHTASANQSAVGALNSSAPHASTSVAPSAALRLAADASPLSAMASGPESSAAATQSSSLAAAPGAASAADSSSATPSPLPPLSAATEAKSEIPSASSLTATSNGSAAEGESGDASDQPRVRAASLDESALAAVLSSARAAQAQATELQQAARDAVSEFVDVHKAPMHAGQAADSAVASASASLFSSPVLAGSSSPTLGATSASRSRSRLSSPSSSPSRTPLPSQLRQPVEWDTQSLLLQQSSVYVHEDDHGLEPAAMATARALRVNPTASPLPTERALSTSRSPATRDRSPSASVVGLSPRSWSARTLRALSPNSLSPSGYGGSGARRTNPVGENGHRVAGLRVASPTRPREWSPRPVAPAPGDQDVFLQYVQHFQKQSRDMTDKAKRSQSVGRPARSSTATNGRFSVVRSVEEDDQGRLQPQFELHTAV